MAKLLVFLLVIVGIYFLIRANKASNPRPKPPATDGAPEVMVRCAHCGVHLPHDEAIFEGERAFCCEEHRRVGDGT